MIRRVAAHGHQGDHERATAPGRGTIVSAGPGAAGEFLRVQRAAGNRAVQRALMGAITQRTDATAIRRSGKGPSGSEIKESKALSNASGDGCVKAAFAPSMPSGTIAATWKPDENWLGGAFVSGATFKPAGTQTDCRMGEYRQFVRGEHKRDGVPQIFPGSSASFSPHSFIEDFGVYAEGTGRFGHREDASLHPRFKHLSQYLPDERGCTYEGYDEPFLMALRAEEKLEISVDFIGQLIDLCEVENPVQYEPYGANEVLAERKWRVEGSCIVPKDWKPAAPKAKKPKLVGPQARKQAMSGSTDKKDSLHRKCSCGGTCERCSMDGFLSGKDAGRSLEPDVREFMESRFAHDFSDVRVHTDTHADRSSRSIDAHAYTAGRDVFFASGQYRPDSGEGRRLLAHELTHVVQQGGGVVSTQAALTVSQPNDPFEHEADAAADAIMAEDAVRAPSVTSLSGGGIQRKACVTGAFTRKPPSTVTATWYPEEGALGGVFHVGAKFTKLGDEVSCKNGEYRQFVRAPIAERDGVSTLASDSWVKADKYVEDKTTVDKELYRSGHRTEQLQERKHHKNFKYSTGAKDDFRGCDFWTGDAPRLRADKSKAGKEQKLKMRYEFIGQLIDKCNTNVDPEQETKEYAKDQTLDTIAWAVVGEHTVPDTWKPEEKTS